MSAIQIVLESFEVETARFVAGRLAEHTANQEDTPDYKGNSYLEPNDVNAFRTCLGEIAIAKALNQYWSPRFWKSEDHAKFNAQYADVGHDVGVRNVRKYLKPIAVKDKDLTSVEKFIVGAYVNLDEPNVVYTPGFLDVHEAWEVGTEDPDPDKNYRRVDWDLFRELEGLRP